MKTKNKISGYILRGVVAMLLLSCVVVGLSAATNLTNSPPKVPAPPNDTAFDVNGHESASSVAAPTIRSNKTLTFADRVAYQRAIEEVYWHHRIWPKENLNPKPSLDAVTSQTQLKNKVADYLRNSQAVEDYWQKSITAEQLQAEMDRMARDTKQPEVLRELFEALGNDPFVIAECLARPTLVERGLAIAETGTPSLEDSRANVETERRCVPSGNYTLPTISDTTTGCTPDTWINTSTTNAPQPREFHTAIWTGTEMIVWGGKMAPFLTLVEDTIPAPIVGHTPARPTRPRTENLTQQYGQALK